MLSKIYKRWFFDEYETSLLQKKREIIKNADPLNNGSFIMIQAPFDYYYLSLYALVINKFKKEGDFKYVAVFPEIFRITPENRLRGIILFFIAIIDRPLIKRKWKKLYKSVGVDIFYELNKIGFSDKLKNFSKAYLVWKKLETKKDLLNLELENLNCGDLIYDTYLRYRVKPTVNIKDKYLLYLIYQCLNVIEGVKIISDKFPLTYYFTSYTTYIQHGIIVRSLVKSKINIYSSGNLQQRFKKIESSDIYHTAHYHNYFSDFQSLNNTNEKLALSRKMLSDKFSGKIDIALSYMKQSSFSQNSSSISPEVSKFDGILFLHDFFDSPHIYGNLLFEDFYEWVIHTIKLISKHNLNIAIKPHPNQVHASEIVIRNLKSEFPSIKWIEPQVSNIAIVNSGIKFGVSVYGTVLHELAYHGIHAICAGDNPHSSYPFIHNPKSINEYDSMLIHFDQLVMVDDYKNQVESFYYMHNINNVNELDIELDSINDFNITNSSSKIIKQILPVL